MQVYYVDIVCDEMKATARIVERAGEYTLVDIRFNKPVGIHSLHFFISDLYKQQTMLLPAVVSQYNESLLKASA